MRRSRLIKRQCLTALSAAATAGTVLLAGCATDECLGNRNALPLAGFYQSRATGSGSSAQMLQLSVDSLQIAGLGAPGDSLLTTGRSPVSESYLPFRIDSDTTAFLFRYLHREFAATGRADTVRFVYNREPRFVSTACGVSYLFTIKEITTTHFLIDSVTCPQMMIDNADIENIHVYFRTSGYDEP